MEQVENDLIGKIVMSKIGASIGVIKKSMVDNDSGEIRSVLIDPSQEIDPEKFSLNEQGDIILPYQNISAVQDMLIFEEKNRLLNSDVKSNF
jgi:sporulation protein YlmC with PRC-barrel domain